MPLPHTIGRCCLLSLAPVLAVVLVGARNPQNIGAAARAMQDFGFSDLRFVNPFTAPFEAAQLDAVKSAVGAAEVMRQARSFPSLAAALADCTLSCGTTAIGARALEQAVLPLQQAVPLLLERLSAEASHPAGKPVEPAADEEIRASNRVALLFGSEKTGLTRDQLSYCDLLTTIPLFSLTAVAGETPRHLSMNLGQAVAVCMYELVRGGFEGAREPPVLHEALSTGEDRKRVAALLMELMQATGYSRRFPANAREPVVRRLAYGLGRTREETATWMGILRQAIAAAEQEQTAAPGGG